MKNKIVFVGLISIILVTGLILVGCNDGCKKNGECVIQDSSTSAARIQYNNCAMVMCSVSNSHLDNPYPTSPGRHVTCDCK